MIIDLEDEKVAEAVGKLEKAGCSLSFLKSSTKENLMEVLGRSYPSEILTLVNAASLKEEAIICEESYARNFMFLGRVECTWDSERRVGTSIIVGPNGLSLTAFHVVGFMQKPHKGKGKQKIVTPSSIEVEYPNLSKKKGKVSFNAVITEIDRANDLALLVPSVRNRYHNLRYLSRWCLLAPTPGTKVLVLSYPALIDKELPSLAKGENKPIVTEGVVAALTMRRIVYTCTAMTGSSGGLVLSTRPYGDAFAVGVHLSSIFEYKEVIGCPDKDLEVLNEKFKMRGDFAFATRTADSILQAYETRNAAEDIPVLDRGERLELLVDKTSHMQNNTFRVKKQAHGLKLQYGGGT